MPFDPVFTDGEQGVVFHGHHEVTVRDILDTVEPLASGAVDITSLRYTLVDYTDCTRATLSSRDVREISDSVRRAVVALPNFCMAIAAPGRLIFGLSRMYATFISDTGWDITVVDTVEEAQEFIRGMLADDSLTFE